MKCIENILYKEALKAYKHKEVPVGCVITKNGKIIAKAHNIRQKTCLCINHAEIIAVLKAEKRIKDWRLDECDLYVTLKPCNMCYEVIKQARIRNVYYILNSNFNNNVKCATYVEYNVDNSLRFRELLSDFFKNKR